MSGISIAGIIYFIVCLIGQVFIFRNLLLFNVGFCFPYIAFILLIPVEISGFWMMIMAFVLGLAIDMFYDSLGIHASALVFLAFIRNFWLSRISPQTGYEPGAKPLVSNYGLAWSILYIVPLVFLHHTLIFFIEIGGWNLIGYTFLKIVTSTAFTATVIILIQYLVPQPKRI